MGRAGRGGGEGEAGQGRLGGADWSKCEVGQGEVPRVLKWVSDPAALWSWQMALCWCLSIGMALSKLEGRRMVEVAPLQRAVSNNDTLWLSLLSGVPPGLKWSAVVRDLDVAALVQHVVQPGALEGCSAPKKVGKHETMEEDGLRPLARPGNLQARKQGCVRPGSESLHQVGVLNPTQL